MGTPFKTTEGHLLSKIGLWFMTTYLYFKLVDDSEKRFMNRKNFTNYAGILDNLLLNKKAVIMIWLNYCLNKAYKETSNKGKVLLKEQKFFANEILKKL